MPTTQTPLQPAWLDALESPATYPHPVSRIQLSETHISWVALTGEWAYKLKKPVDFGFVDFTTLELRRAACHEEIRLNRRTAPELYDDVVTLIEEHSGPRFGGTGRVLEYVVRMRQFAQEDMLNQCLERGELSGDVIDTLAREVAELHRRAAVASSESPFGDPDSIHAAVQVCLDHPSCKLPIRQSLQGRHRVDVPQGYVFHF
jgi:aminoglycoside phosphotransferase family enzyme